MNIIKNYYSETDVYTADLIMTLAVIFFFITLFGFIYTAIYEVENEYRYTLLPFLLGFLFSYGAYHDTLKYYKAKISYLEDSINRKK